MKKRYIFDLSKQTRKMPNTTTSAADLKKIIDSKSKYLGNNQMIRVTAENESYWLMKNNGIIYIGYLIKDGEMPKYNSGAQYEMFSATGLESVWQRL